jgi:hypothetical protein
MEIAVAQQAIDYVRSLDAKPEDKSSARKPPWSSSEEDDV